MSDVLVAIPQIVVEKLQEARPQDVVWGAFAFTALVISWVMFFSNRILQRRHERKLRHSRIDNRRVRGVFFDLTQGTLRAQPLAKFSLDDWDESLRTLIREWGQNSEESALIIPDDDRDADALADMIHTEASELLIQSVPGIRGFLDEHQIINEDDGFRHVRFLAALARPRSDKITWFDAARLVIIPINSARKIANQGDESHLHTRLSAANRKTWSRILARMGLRYIKAQHKCPDQMRGMTIVDIAV